MLIHEEPGFALLDFAARGDRSAETRRLDLGHPSAFGALRFGRLRVDAGGGQYGAEGRRPPQEFGTPLRFHGQESDRTRRGGGHAG
ncbi:MAG: hypothetical protein EBR23_15570, partial [Planctomycetia bacterium]|nr:hypothetical protein [Planctomycetia bacterium]